MQVDGTTALWKAAYFGHQKVVSFLASKGADIRALSLTGESVLYAAAQKGRTAVVQMLVGEYGLSSNEVRVRVRVRGVPCVVPLVPCVAPLVPCAAPLVPCVVPLVPP